MRNDILVLCSTLVHSFLYAQNVGINTVNPTRAKLELNGMIGNTTAIFGGDGHGVGLIASSPEIGFNTYYNGGTRYINNGYGLIQSFGPTSGYWVWDVHAVGIKDQLSSSVKRGLILSNNGRAGISDNTGFIATLNVARPPGFDGTAYFPNSANLTYSAFNYTTSETTILRGLPVYFNQNTTNSKFVIGYGTALLGIGWTDPVYPLEVHGNDYQLALSRSGTQNRWNLGTSLHLNPYLTLGTVPAFNTGVSQRGYYSYTNGAYFAVSDNRLKENIVQLTPMLDKIMRLRPVNYEMKYNNPSHDKAIGLIAQELALVLPELVHTKDGTYSGYKEIDKVHLVNYSGLAPVVIKGLQEQQQVLDDITARIAKLESIFRH